MDESAGALLQPFCLLAKSAKGVACASLIKQVLDHPSIFVFGELLDMPSVKEVCPSPMPPCRVAVLTLLTAMCGRMRAA